MEPRHIKGPFVSSAKARQKKGFGDENVHFFRVKAPPAKRSEKAYGTGVTCESVPGSLGKKFNSAYVTLCSV